jgi:hypothetical protein
MALKQDFTFQDNFKRNVHFNDCYAKISGIEGTKENITFTLEIKQNAEDNFVLKSKHYVFTPNLDGKNFIAQAYDYLKTLEEFANAKDC